jgi:hypothetical protein
LRGKRIHTQRKRRASLSRIKTSATTTTHVDDQTQQLVDFRLESERFGFFFSRHDDDDDESVCVRVLCALRNGEKKSLEKKDG